MNSGLTRREIEKRASHQGFDGTRGLWTSIELARRNKSHPELQERREYFWGSCVNFVAGILEIVLVVGGTIAAVVVLSVALPLVGQWFERWAVPIVIVVLSIPTGIILAAIIRAIAYRIELSREILSQNYDNRTKIGQILIVSCQLSMRAELETILGDCLELREEQAISEFYFWFSFCSSSMAKVKRHRASWLSRKRKRMAEQK